MKKLVLLSLLTVKGFALQVGNPAGASLLTEDIDLFGCDWLPDCIGIELGFYGDYVFDKKLKENSSNLGALAGIPRTTVMTNAGLLVVNWCNYVNLEVTLGASRLGITEYFEAIDAAAFNSSGMFYDSVSDFSWSIGGRATIWQCNCLSLGLVGQYFSTNPSINAVDLKGNNSVVYPGSFSWDYSEWLVAAGLSYQVNLAPTISIVPYAAVDYNRVNLSFNETGFLIPTAGLSIQLADKEKMINWGYALGMTLVGCDRFDVTVEGRFSNERAFAMNTLFRF